MTLTKDKREALEHLLERVKGAEGPDREIDAALGEQFGWRWITTDVAFGYWSGPEDFDCFGFDGDLPRFTEDMNAALALMEREFPDAVWHVMTDYGGLNRAKIGPASNPSASIYNAGDRELFTQDDADTPPLAILAALLSAKLTGREGE